MTSLVNSRPAPAAIVGTGLIGGSIGLALRARGWHVTGRDLDGDRAARALELGALDAVGDDPAADVTFVARRCSSIAAEARAALAGGSGVVTDVGSVKGPVVAAVDDPRFVGGHPMAGSEQEGSTAPTPSCSRGRRGCSRPASTPTPRRSPACGRWCRRMGADVVALQPDRHDAGGGHGVPRAPPHRRHPDGPRHRRRRPSTPPSCGWRPAGSGT